MKKQFFALVTLACFLVSSCAASQVSATLPIVVTPDTLAFLTAALPQAQENHPYSTTIQMQGGVSPYTFKLDCGTTLPPGLTLDAAKGIIAGTIPTGTVPAGSNSRTFKFVITVTDSAPAPTGGYPAPNCTALLAQTASIRVIAGGN